MASTSFAIVICVFLVVAAEAERRGNRNGPSGRWVPDSEDQGRWEGGRMGGKGDWGMKFGHGHGGMGGGLSFLANMTREERGEVFAIFKNRTLDKAAKDAAIEALVFTLDPSVQAAYKEWKTEKDAALAAKIAALSPEAKAAYEARQVIENDATLSAQEKWTELRDFDRNQTADVRKELRGLIWGGKGGFGFGKRGGFGSDEKHFRGKKHGPSFLANVTDASVLAEFKAIFKNKALDKTAKEAAIDALVATLDSSIQAAYEAWKEERAIELADKIAALSADAKTAYDNCTATESSTTLSADEKKAQIHDLMAGLTREVRKEVQSLCGGHHGGHGGGHGGRGGHGRHGQGGRRGDRGEGEGRPFGGPGFSRRF